MITEQVAFPVTNKQANDAIILGTHPCCSDVFLVPIDTTVLLSEWEKIHMKIGLSASIDDANCGGSTWLRLPPGIATLSHTLRCDDSNAQTLLTLAHVPGLVHRGGLTILTTSMCFIWNASSYTFTLATLEIASLWVVFLECLLIVGTFRTKTIIMCVALKCCFRDTRRCASVRCWFDFPRWQPPANAQKGELLAFT